MMPTMHKELFVVVLYSMSVNPWGGHILDEREVKSVMFEKA
jgi:hypothetical protein